MNINEAKTILLLYRPGSADAQDPQIAEALQLAKQDGELSRWFGERCAGQAALRAKFRQIKAPAGLREQILSEQAAAERRKARRMSLTLAAAAFAVAGLCLAVWLFPRHPADDNLAEYQKLMARVALKGYYMDLATNDPVPIQAHFRENHAPADYHLPPALARATLAGCAVQAWQEEKVSMICFRSGRPQRANQGPDLWLFVVDRNAIPDAPPPGAPKIAEVDKVMTAVWSQDDKVYLLEMQGDEAALRKFL